MIDAGQRQLRAHRPHRRGRDRPPSAGGPRPRMASTENSGDSRAKATATTAPTRSRLRWSGACARWASASRSTPRATFRRRRLPTSSRPMTTTGDCCSSSPRRVERRHPVRNQAPQTSSSPATSLSSASIIVSLRAVSGLVIVNKPTNLGLDLQGRRAARPTGPPDPAAAGRSTDGIYGNGHRHHPLPDRSSSASPRSKLSRVGAATRSRSGIPDVTSDAEARPNRDDRSRLAPSLFDFGNRT